MTKVKEPTVEEFFASASGVCVYVNVGGQTQRVEFQTEDSEGIVRGVTLEASAEARRAAEAALERFRLDLQPLFARVRAELASRAGETPGESQE